MGHNSGIEHDFERNSSRDVVTKIQYSKSSKCWLSKPVRKKKQNGYLQEIMEEVVRIKAKNITLEIPDPSKTLTNIATIPCSENIDSHKIVRSRFI